MIVLQCVDDRGGTLFNHRRQSQDRLLRARILKDTAGGRLWMNAYSYRQFAGDGAAPPVLLDENFLSLAAEEDFCFVEGLPLSPWLSNIRQIILYRWNRTYPADTYLDLSLVPPAWELVRREEFQGSSHPTITKEVYIQCAAKSTI